MRLLPRLQPGDPAPVFVMHDIHGGRVALHDYIGKRVMLSFYRFASCPLCNLRIHELLAHHDAWAAHGLHLIACFQSPAESMRRHAERHAAPFPIIADPEMQLYWRYSVTASWGAMFRAGVVNRALEAIIDKRFLPGSIDGHVAMRPADFLIDEQQIVRVAYYGEDIGDHLPIADIQAFTNGLATESRIASETT